MRIIGSLSSTSVLLLFLFPQALAAPPGAHLNIEEVAVSVGDTVTTLDIMGVDFDFGGPLEVTLAGAPALTVTLTSSTTITATVLTASYKAGDYLLTVSTGNGQSQNDEYDLTIGAVGPAGPEGAAGVDGDDGTPGADGVDGQDGTSCSVDEAVGSATVNCTDGSSVTVFNGAGGAPGQDGEDGAEGPEGPAGPPGEQGPPGTAGDVCDLEIRIKLANPAFELDEACVVSTEGVIFVANSGNDSNPGTQALPVATIDAGNALAAMSNSELHVQTGSYTRFSVTDGVSVIGGFDASWQQQQLETFVIDLTDIAVQAANIGQPTVIQYLTIASGDSGDGSSLGLRATESDGLSILDSFITAVAGANGGNGGNGSIRSAGIPGGNGQNGLENDPFFTCVQNPAPARGFGGSPGGGNGGFAGLGSASGSAGSQGQSGTAGGSGGSPGGNGGKGDDGADGAIAMDGAAGQPSYASSGYSATDGGDGQDGNDGSGGGGGGGGGGGSGFGQCDDYGGAGGGGGGFGDGGTRGTGGDSAGGSFAVYLWNSDIVIERTELITGDGGKGGNGGGGGMGRPGAAGGSGGNLNDNSGAGGNGGRGGNGSRGGHGGNGRGGPSIGILLGGDSNPALDSVIYTLGSAGSGGTGLGPSASAAVGAQTHSPPP